MLLDQRVFWSDDLTDVSEARSFLIKWASRHRHWPIQVTNGIDLRSAGHKSITSITEPWLLLQASSQHYKYYYHYYQNVCQRYDSVNRYSLSVWDVPPASWPCRWQVDWDPPTTAEAPSIRCCKCCHSYSAPCQPSTTSTLYASCRSAAQALPYLHNNTSITQFTQVRRQEGSARLTLRSTNQLLLDNLASPPN